MNRRYLITGSQGLVGRYLTAEILRKEPDAHVLGIGRSENLPGFFTHAIGVNGRQLRAPVPADLSIDGHYRYQQLSLLATDRLRDVVERFEPDCVFHLASALHTAPEHELFEANLEGTASLMNALATTKALVVLGSSGSVYGEPVLLPLAEAHPCNPADLYGITKLAAEQIGRVKAARAGLPFIAARIFNVAGAGQSESHVCGRFAAQLASDPEPATLAVGPLDTTRDFIDVRDVARALLLLAHKGTHGTAYNIASGQETPIQTILAELLRISVLDGQLEIIPKSGPPAGVSRHFADVTRLSQLDFTPTYSLSQSLESLFAYHKSI